MERAAELRDEALFKDPPPAKEDCPICFLPMPSNVICCISLPPATIFSVPIYDYAVANEELAGKATEVYYSCCGKSVCGGCVHSFAKCGNMRICPFCKAEDRYTYIDVVEELMKRVNVQDGGAMCELAKYYYHGLEGLQQDRTKAIELFTRAAKLGSSSAHHYLGVHYDKGGNLKKAKFHFEAAAMAGHELTRHNLASLEGKSGFVGRLRAMKHLMIGASSGCYTAMHFMQKAFEQGLISRDEIDSILTAYNNSCAEMRSEARDAYMRDFGDYRRKKPKLPH
jgi:hypothetical protein